jgi:hypothetical protein
MYVKGTQLLYVGNTRILHCCKKTLEFSLYLKKTVTVWYTCVYNCNWYHIHTCCTASRVHVPGMP